MASHTQFDNVFHGLDTKVGRMRVASIGLAWKSMEGDSTVTVPADNIKYVQWVRVARNFQLRVVLKADRKRETFDGFLREDHDKVANLTKQLFGLMLEVKETSMKGWNWGTTDIQGNDLAFLVSNKPVFELPLNSIANSNIAGKTEVSLEFTPIVQSGKKAGRSHAIDELVEVRLYVPGSRSKGSDDEEDVDEDDETSAAQAFHDLIKDKADIGDVIGQAIVTFSEILVQTPRGRYDIDMFPTFLRLRGKTYDYKILYTSITRLFLLPRPDDIHVQLVIGLDPPIRQGQTRYPYLLIMFSKEEELDVELNIEQETIDQEYDGKLKKKYDHPTFQVVSEVFRGLSGRKLTAPGSFASRNNQQGIKANFKAVLGELYFLEKSLIFVAKQPVVIDYADVHQVVFSRVGGMSFARTFDVRVVCKNGPISEITFTSINKEEHEPVEHFLIAKKLRVKNEINEEDVMMAAAAMDDSDEDMDSDDSDNSLPKPKKPVNFEDEDSEEDEDFAASTSDEGSPSESDSEADSILSGASGDLDIVKVTKAPKKKKKKAVEAVDGDAGGEEAPPKKKKKKAKVDGDAGAGADGDVMEVDVDKPKPKPKPKPAKKGSPSAKVEDEGPKKKRPKTSSD